MGDIPYAENADMPYMYGRANGNGRAALRKYHAKFPDRRSQKFSAITSSTSRNTRSFYVIRHDAGRQTAVRSPSLEESILNVVDVRPESSTRAVGYLPVRGTAM
ncbi:hypothetical protein TNCV_2632521 [Trichonephila clavipes]|nr:hypothetical protein TNCV_2632521 [Trichonephila clavipes]